MTADELVATRVEAERRPFAAVPSPGERSGENPTAALGRWIEAGTAVVRVLAPGAASVRIGDALELRRIPGTDLFEWRGPPQRVGERYRVTVRAPSGQETTAYDPYCFPPLIPEEELTRFATGEHLLAYRSLGAQARAVEGIAGLLFAVWAPRAQGVSVVGDFNGWDARRHPLRRRGASGVWELFVPGPGPGSAYRFAIRARTPGPTPGEAQDRQLARRDPFARHLLAAGSADAIAAAETPYAWGDGEWMARRQAVDWLRGPVSICELDPGMAVGDPPVGWRRLAERIVPRAKALGFTHVGLPSPSAPAGAAADSTGELFAPAGPGQTADDLRFFVERCHQGGLGVLFDWPVARVPPGDRSLIEFDGQPLFEAANQGGAWRFDFRRGGVRSLLLSSALYRLRELHGDGLRLPAMESMLYLDQDRGEGEWTPNKYGGNEDLEAVAFLRDLTDRLRAAEPGTLLIAQEASAWPQVTRPSWVGGLGFDLRWHLGWEHDTLEYFGHDPVYRHYHHDLLTLSLLEATRESFLLPLDRSQLAGEHGPLLERMPGDPWQRLANLRLLLTYAWTHPGKKLLFGGGTEGLVRRWDARRATGEPPPEQAGVEALIRDLNRLYRASPALHGQDAAPRGFEWIDRHDAPQSCLAYLRRDGERVMVVALNFTPVPRHQYRIGVPYPGSYEEVLNSDSAYYGGSNLGNGGDLTAEPLPWMGRPYSLSIVLPPLAGVVLEPRATRDGGP
jgi:1,4-alpha-glucan branching enzyme